MLSYEDRCIGMMLCGAVGDALGAGVEFRSMEWVKDEYPNGVRDYCGKFPGRYTDDACLMMSLASSLIRVGYVDGEDCARSAVEWWKKLPVRGFGPNTLSALRRLDEGESWMDTGSLMPSNGAVMRIGPVGVVGGGEEIFGLARSCCWWSHCDSDALASAGCVALQISNFLKGREELSSHPEIVSRLVAASMFSDDEDRVRSIVTPNRFGDNFAINCWEAVAMAYLFMISDRGDPYEAMCHAASVGGDSDTVCCILGQMLGAAYGYEWLPSRWLDGLENDHGTGRDAIIETGIRLAAISSVQS